MPPRLDDAMSGELFLINQDGTYAKLTDIKDIDIGMSEPPEPFQTGGYISYDDYKPPFIDNTDYSYEFPIKPINTDYSCEFPLKPINMSMKKLYMALIGMTQRQMRLAIRHMERLRRKELKTGVKIDNKLVVACMEVMKNSNPFIAAYKQTQNTNEV